MKRRELLKNSIILPFLINSVFSQEKRRRQKAMKIIKPKRLSKGDTVALITPASGVEEGVFERALLNIEDLGFRVKTGKNARARNGFLAGNDRERIADLHTAFADKSVKAVWCARGGYGMTRILPDVDFKLIKNNPKIFIGYSDITALHTAIYQKTGLVTFHGPVAASSYSDYVKDHLINVISNPSANYKIEISPTNFVNESSVYKTQTITPGKTSGKLIGGNLSLLAAMTGTPFALKNTTGKILFIEDVGEAPYRIDRMLTQLLQSIDMKSLSGIALGIFKDCETKDENSQSLMEVLKDRLGDLKIPVIYGLSFGHISDQCTLPVGIKAELDTEKALITLTEPAVI